MSRSDAAGRPQRTALGEWLRFTLSSAHVLGVRPRLLVQQAAHQPAGTAPEVAARDRLSAGREPRPWLRRVNRTGGPAPLLFVLPAREPCAFSPDGGRILAVAGDDDRGGRSTLVLWDARSGARRSTLAGHRADVRQLAFSPDGGRAVSASDDGTLRLWDAETGAEIAVLAGHRDGVVACAFSPDGRRIVSGAADATVRLWDGETGEPVATMTGHELVVLTCAFSPDGARVASYGRDETLRVWDGATGAEVAWSGRHQSAVGPCLFAPDSRRLLSRSGEQMALWSASGAYAIAGEPSPRLARLQTFGHPLGGRAFIQDFAFSPDGRRIVSASQDRTLGLWDGETGRRLATLEGHEGIVTSCAFSPDGDRILSASADGTLRLWDAASGAPSTTLAGHGGGVAHATFSPDGDRILSVGGGRLKVWETAAMGAPAEPAGHRGDPFACAFSPDGSAFLSAATERQTLGLGTSPSELKLWSGETGEELAGVKPHTDAMTGHVCQLTCCEFFPDSKRVVAGFMFDDGEQGLENEEGVRIWNAATGREEARFELPAAPSHLKVSPDGKRLVCASGEIRLLDAASGAEILRFGGPWRGGDRIALFPDGERLASAFCARTNTRGTVWLWDLSTGEELAAFESDPQRSLADFALSRDGRYLAIADATRRITVWEVPSRAQLAVLEGSRCEFAADGSVILSVDGPVIGLWSPTTGARLGTLEGHTAPVIACLPSPDGRRVASLSRDGTLKVWSVEKATVVYEWFRRGARVGSWSPDGRRLAIGGGGDGVPLLLQLEDPAASRPAPAADA